jgi:hypothetical protein
MNDYSKGYNSFLSNDKFPVSSDGANLFRLAQNARITTLGEYETRKGFDLHSVAAGETQDDEQETVTGAADQSFSTTTWLTQVFTATVAGVCPRLDVNIKNDAGATGTVIIELWSNSGGEPDEMLGRSSIANSSITSSYAYISVRFDNAPTLTATDYWIVAYVQDGGTGSFKWSSTTAATTALSSTDLGNTWAATSYDLNFKQFYATAGAVKGLHRAYKSDGTVKTLFAQGTVLYSVDDVTGALTTVKSGLDASASQYRFVTVNDIVYYVNGYDGLRKWDFTTESQVNATDYTLIAEHKGLLFLLEKADPNKVVYSNFADYETFTSTDFIYVPSPKTGDPVTALISLNGYMMIPTLDNKYILSGDDNATFRLDEAPDQKGTYSQETICADKNFIYYLSNDGVYRSNGSEAQLLSENIFEDVKNLQTKDSACVAINNGRLYVWYTSAGSAYNDSCWVWNNNFSEGGRDTVESLDTKAYVGRAATGYRDDDKLFVASSICGQVFYQELPSNDYNNLGNDIEYLLQTHYFTFTSPSVLKEVRYWIPRFSAQSSPYTITQEYAYDLRDNWTLNQNPNVQGAGETYGGGAEYGDGSTYGSTAEVQNSTYVPGEYRRIAIRYKHYATREPQNFLGHTIVAQQRRIR